MNEGFKKKLHFFNKGHPIRDSTEKISRNKGHVFLSSTELNQNKGQKKSAIIAKLKLEIPMVVLILSWPIPMLRQSNNLISTVVSISTIKYTYIVMKHNSVTI